MQTDPFVLKLGAKMQWTDTPALDAPTIAHGLALGAANTDHDGFDMARSLKPPLSFREMFPWKELAAQITIVLGLAAFFYIKASDLDEKYDAAHLELTQRSWQQGVDDSELIKEKKDLNEHVGAVQKFLSSRIIWSHFSKDISEKLPTNASVQQVHGMAEFSTDATKPGQRALMIKGAIPIAAKSRVPVEIETFLTALNNDPLILKEFPLIHMEEVHWTQPPDPKAWPIATFSISCIPKAREKKAQPAATSSASK
jgi:hypothetical protein